MDIVIPVLLLITGFVLLIKGADWFVDGSSKIADRFGISQLVIGLTIVAMGTSLPEAAVSIASALKGNAGITIGNVVGSNIMNILVILGLTAMVRVIPVQKSTVRYEIPFMIFVTVLLAVLGLWDNRVNRLEGMVLWGFMILYLLYLLKMAKGGDSQEEIPRMEKTGRVPKMLGMVVFGAVMIVIGSDVTVNAATELALLFRIDDRIIGLTIVAFGTSLPELVTSVAAAWKGKADIAVGNIVGSNIFNILFVVGTSALITPVEYKADFLADSIAAAAAAVLLLICVVQKRRLGRLGGAVMLAGYAVYFMYLIR